MTTEARRIKQFMKWIDSKIAQHDVKLSGSTASKPMTRLVVLSKCQVFRVVRTAAKQILKEGK